MNNKERANPSELRIRYTKGELMEQQAHKSPFNQFKEWFEEAVASGITEPNAMTLATVDEYGMPNARVVLLKEYSEDGFVFFTNYGSKKAEELQANPWCSVVFLWKEAERQVRIRGRAEQLSRERSQSYFYSRPRESQIGAWASRQSTKVASRAEMQNRYKKLASEFKNREIPYPDFWGGYLIQPTCFEFWQGRPGRMHDRLVYEKEKPEKWSIYRLYP